MSSKCFTSSYTDITTIIKDVTQPVVTKQGPGAMSDIEPPPPSTREENAVNGSLTMCDTSNDFTIH